MAIPENPCRALVPAKNPNIPQPSYFINITIPQIRIKVPKSVAKTIQKRSRASNNEGRADTHRSCKNKIKKWVKDPQRLLPKKVGSIVSSVFGNRKSLHSNGWKGRVYSSGTDSFSELTEEDDSNLGSFQNQSKSSCDRRFSFGGTEDHSESKYNFNSLKNIMESEDNETRAAGFEEKKNWFRRKAILGEKPSSFSSFFNEKTDLRRKTSSVNGSTCSSGSTSGKSDGSVINGLTLQNMRTGRFMLKKVRKLIVEEESDDEEIEEMRSDDELCKKRILMGERCKPLNKSGTLSYDKNGILTPEVIP